MDITSSSKWKELTRKIKFIDGTTYQRTLELFYAEFGMKMLEDDALRRFITTYQNKKIGLYYTKVKEDFYQLGADDLANAKRRSRSKLENKLVDEIGTVEDIESYKEALELYYNVFGDDMFEIEKVQRFIDAFELDNINITPNTVYRDLRAIKSAFGSRDEISQSNFTSLHPDIKPVKTIAPPVQAQRTQVQNKNIISPVQTQRTQVQNISNNILDEYMLIETVRTMPLWLNSESVSISKNSSINSLCAGLVNNAMSDFATQETFVQFENIIQQKRLRTSNKAEYNRKMENNIFYELFCYSYLINVFEAVPKIMSGSLNVNFEKYVSLAENECRKRVQNLDQEKRKIHNIETILNKYNQSTTQYKMPNLGLINQRENDYIIAQLMHNCVIPCIAPLFYDSKEQWKIFDTISAKEFAQTLDIYLSQAISMRLSTYAGDKIFNIQ